MLDINLTSIFLGYQAVLPALKENKGGSIINMSSMAGLVGNFGAGPYTASKSAIRVFTKAAAIDYAKENIRSNSIHPGYIHTAMTEKVLEDPKTTQRCLSQTPLPRLGEAIDVANAVLFLASDESSFITGVEIPVDGAFAQDNISTRFHSPLAALNVISLVHFFWRSKRNEQPFTPNKNASLMKIIPQEPTFL